MTDDGYHISHVKQIGLFSLPIPNVLNEEDGQVCGQLRCRKITGDFDASETLQNIIANNEAFENVRNAEAHVAGSALSIILAIKAWLMVI